jgi:hypothetical protein
MGLQAPAANCNEDAARLILDHGLTLHHIVSVDYDSVLYLNALENPRTLWLHQPQRGRLRIHMESGFGASPPEGWHDERPGDRMGAPAGV